MSDKTRKAIAARIAKKAAAAIKDKDLKANVKITTTVTPSTVVSDKPA